METPAPKATQKQLMKLTKKELCEIILRKDEIEDTIKKNVSNLNNQIAEDEKKLDELRKLYKTYIMDNDNLLTKCISLSGKLFKYRLFVVVLIILIVILGMMLVL